MEEQKLYFSLLLLFSNCCIKKRIFSATAPKEKLYLLATEKLFAPQKTDPRGKFRSVEMSFKLETLAI